MLFIAGILCATLCLNTQNITVKAMDSQESISAITRSAIIDWRYKVENGRLYKRLYNYTYQNWVGDWELC
jgi:hypothetical protein